MGIGEAATSVGELGQALQRFAWPDYMVFVLMLALCAMIGVYFGYWATGNGDEAEYLMGGRQMQTLPISMSLVASYVSGITLLGFPTEVYVYGSQVMWMCVGILLFGLVFASTMLPLLHELQLMTLYQYLQLRFDKRVRMFGSIFFTISLIAWLPIVILVPALAFNQVTGVNIHVISPAVCAVCVFYTCVGGIKAVVWTDVVQTVSMIGCICLVAIRGTYNVGGINVVAERAIQSSRLEAPLMDTNPLQRQTFWTSSLGVFFNILIGGGLSQAMTQRYLALPTLRQAKRSVWLFVLGVYILFFVSVYCGLLIYATYHDCDPITTKLAKAKDQLLPLLVMETLGDVPGLPGLFVAGVFSAALSSLSTGLNSMSAVVVEDFWRPLAKSPPSKQAVNIVMRLVVVVFGAICVGLVFVVEKLGVVLQLSSSLGSISSGPMLAVFVEAMFLPWVNSTGCLAGAGAGLGFSTWLVLSAQHAIAHGRLTFPEKPVTVSGCTYLFNATTPAAAGLGAGADIAPAFWLFRISYQWYAPLGCIVSLIVAILVSLATRDPSVSVDPRLVSPLVRGLLNRPPALGEDSTLHVAESKESKELKKDACVKAVLESSI